ncbi:hypothetical protein CtCNB1_4282 [Comamonas thiooxydans]|nr:hypothetical protein CtCNB1_4282 [Comamonas thiooxydans]
MTLNPVWTDNCQIAISGVPTWTVPVQPVIHRRPQWLRSWPTDRLPRIGSRHRPPRIPCLAILATCCLASRPSGRPAVRSTARSFKLASSAPH